MSFLTPWAAALAGAVVLPLLVLMYFLKLRRKQVMVPSTLLWRKSVQDLQASAPFQKLRRNLLLILQVLILLGLLFALARPTVDGWAASGRRVVIVIDHSASMNATDADPANPGFTRLEEARRLAHDLARDAARAGGAMLVALATEPQIIEPFTRDESRLSRSIERIEATDEPGRLGPALELIEQFAKQQPGLEVYILSDGRFPPEATQTLEGSATVRLMRLGRDAAVAASAKQPPAFNLGIVALAARRHPVNENQLELFAGLGNDSPQQQRAKLAVRVDGRLIRVIDITLAPTAADAAQLAVTPVSFTMDQADGALVELTLTQDAGQGDLLASDDVARMVLAPQRPTRVMLVGHARGFTARALEAGGLARVNVVTSDVYETLAASPQEMAAYDVVVFDGYEPTAPPSIGALSLGASAPQAGVKRVVEPSQAPAAILSWRNEHELMRYAGLDDLVLGQAVRLAVPDDAQVLATTAAGPLVAAVDRQGRRSVVVGFSPLESNWPLLVGYPVFISNAVQWLASAQQHTGLVHRPGQALSLPASAAASLQPGMTFTYDGPDDLAVRLLAGRLMVQPARRSGVYRASGATVRQPWDVLAVSLLDATESDLRPVDELVVGSQAVQVVQPSQTQVRTAVHHWFLLAALAVLLVEWAVYVRRSSM